MVSLRLGDMDRWFEEDEPIHAHPRNPYHRVGVRPSSRHVVVRHDGLVVGETDRPRLLFQTGNPTCFYPDKVEVEVDGERVTE